MLSAAALGHSNVSEAAIQLDHQQQARQEKDTLTEQGLKEHPPITRETTSTS